MRQIRSKQGSPGESGLSSAFLRGIAMAAMLCDHIWVTGLAEARWLTCVGRIAFPIYGFLLVEGYFQTGSLRKYALRLLTAALLSEIPFNMMTAGRIFYSGHQNVIWTLLLSLGMIYVMEKGKTFSQRMHIFVIVPSMLAGLMLALVLRVDYGYGGVFTVLAFYLFRGRSQRDFWGQLLMLLFINLAILDGSFCQIFVLGTNIKIPVQIFAVLCLIPIWLYGGSQGHRSKPLRYLYYGFYPLHMLILVLLSHLD